jgi:hypothetical protein
LQLLKDLYGLKQAGRRWYMEMSKAFIKKMGFQHSAIKHSVFYHKTEDEHTKIRKIWDITEWFLDFKIKRDWNSRTISINQHVYIKKMAERF